MRDDVPADGLLVVGSEHRPAVDLRYNLVSDDDGHTEFVGEALKVPQEFRQTHLTG